MDPSIRTVPNWNKKFQDQQYVTEDYHFMSYTPISAVYGSRKFNDYSIAFGSGVVPITFKLACVYLAGLAAARSQFIPGYLYFRNRNFNWVGSLKFLAAGYITAEILSIFAFGTPFLVEDKIRRKLRVLTAPLYFELGPINR
jgi:hypothetical protein